MIRKYTTICHKGKGKKFVLSIGKVCFLFSSVFFVGGVFWAIQSTLVFSKISSLEREENKLTQEKSSLEERLFKADSLNNAMLRSRDKGFTSIVSFVYLSDEKPVAKLP